ncbi:ATP-binding cassette domain-containing protein [Pseudofrankia sp. BMG5.37]|uniref:ATP-binding cassette domain-containing protein n=1 Tax=Pseudofrankia sp. BMG5.37 TaxID=3050035 RepID=UPI0028957CB4|nr:ATP-binding cassette domain-containing protein [Pseudofrankia sp. BMG5.37]MDT3443404.1 ATP-binding cassette domain-containing protein [Pseudofrankia sp. BMG5.37]
MPLSQRSAGTGFADRAGASGVAEPVGTPGDAAAPAPTAAAVGAGGPPRLRVENVSKTFGRNRALRDVRLDLRPGEIHALVGQNGSGKSTLAKVLTGYHAPDPGGRVLVDGVELRLPVRPRQARAAGVAVVHQSLGLVGEASVVENLRVGRFRAGRFSRRIRWREEREAALAVLERLGRPLPLHVPVASLPEEARATVAIARALQDAHPGHGMIIFDESTRSLGREALEHFYGILDEVVATGTAVLMITHRLEEVVEAADRVTVLRDGVAAESGLPTQGLRATDLARLVLGRALTSMPGPVRTPPDQPATPAPPPASAAVPARTGASADQASVETASVETVPVETVPVETVPVETVPVETVPVETVPAETVPVETVPVETVPVETVPAEMVPAEMVLVEVAPADSESAGSGVPARAATPAKPAEPFVELVGVSGAIARDVSLRLEPGEIVGVTGLTASGYDELPYLVAGARRAGAGRLTVAGTSLDLTSLDSRAAIAAGVALVPEAREHAGLALELTVGENVLLPRVAQAAGDDGPAAHAGRRGRREGEAGDGADVPRRHRGHGGQGGQAGRAGRLRGGGADGRSSSRAVRGRAGRGRRRDWYRHEPPGRMRGGLMPVDRDAERAFVKHWINAVDVRPPAPELAAGKLSGGNQQKVLLAKWLAVRPRLLVLHEPTQAVDVGARHTIIATIREAAVRGCAVLVAGSDENELALLCDRVVVFRDGRAAEELTDDLAPDAIVAATFSTGDRRALRSPSRASASAGGVGDG